MNQLISSLLFQERAIGIPSYIKYYLWPGGIIPYEIDTNAYSKFINLNDNWPTKSLRLTDLISGSNEQALIISAMNMLTQKTDGCIKFTPKTVDNKNFVSIKKIMSCYSAVSLKILTDYSIKVSLMKLLSKDGSQKRWSRYLIGRCLFE